MACPMSQCFALAVDAAYEPGLFAVVNSIYAYHRDSVPVRIYYRDISRESLAWLGRHPARPTLVNLLHLPTAHRGMWEVKQQIPAWEMLHSRLVFLLDVDCVLCSPMHDIFNLAAEGFIVGAKDGAGVVEYTDDYRIYGIHPGEIHHYINTGALCLDTATHWPILAAWTFSASHARYSNGPRASSANLNLPGHGDQGLFNAIVAGLGRSEAVYALPGEEWCDAWSRGRPRIRSSGNPVVLHIVNEITGLRQRLIHSSGPKWWTADGRLAQARQGDKLKIFEHFNAVEFA